MARKNTQDAFDDLLNSNSTTVKPAPKSKKANAEIIPVPDNVQGEIDNLLGAKKKKKTAESDIKKSEPVIIDHGTSMKDNNAFAGKFQKSYKLGNEDSHVNFITANKWSFQEEDVEEIKGIIGDNADDLIIQDKNVQLKKGVFADQDLMKKFIKMVGKQFPEFFETVVSHHVSENFDEKIYALGEDALEDLRLLMKQSKPSLR